VPAERSGEPPERQPAAAGDGRGRGEERPVTRPWQVLARAETSEGTLELRRRGAGEVVITAGGRVLMNGAAHRSEAALAAAACRQLAGSPRPRVLLGGLGLGFTLRAALAILPRHAAVLVAEIEPAIVAWCRGPLADLTAGALDDPRVRVEIGDVAAVISRAARPAAAGSGSAHGSARGNGGGGGDGDFDAIVLDLYEGPRTPVHGADDPLYGRAALERCRAALAAGGVLAVWSEDPDASFEKRLAAAGFRWRKERPAGHGRHTIYIANPAAAGPERGTPPRRTGGRSGRR
jgi:spermidine synthase